MRNKTSVFKRSLAALLCFVMILGMFPALGGGKIALEAEAAPAEGTNYITLPITIRDFAADGMLFEFNEMGESTFTAPDDGSAEYNPDGTTISWGNPTTFTITDRYHTANSTASAPEYYTAVYNPSATTVSNAGYKGIYLVPAGKNFSSLGFGDWWYCLIIDDNGNVLKALPAGEGSKATFYDDMAATDAAYSVWTWRAPINLAAYTLMAKVTEKNYAQFRVGFYNYDYPSYSPSNWDQTDTIYFYLGTKYNTTGASDSFYVSKGNALLAGSINAYSWWKRIVCDSSGQIVKIISVGDDADYSAYDKGDYTIVLAFSNDTTSLSAISHITDENMSEYQIKTATCGLGGALFIERTITANASNTKGFGLLYTTADDYRHWLNDGEDDYNNNDAANFPNTAYYEYAYNFATETDGITIPYSVGLWDATPAGTEPTPYAYQDIYEVGIRTNLVGKTLDKEGKPVYTQATVDFLANYMAMVMPVEEKTNGAYNTNHVMGVDLFDANGKYVDIKGANADAADTDLAQVLRDKVYATTGTSYTLGTYTASKEKFDKGGLRTYKDVETWYDAAYFLLHNTWRDSDDDATEAGSDGYGKPSNYHSMHLMETTNEKGQTTYVFNAKYDGTVYNHGDGEIYNTPFTGTNSAGEAVNATNRDYSFAYKYDGEPDTAYDVELPDKRFDPLGLSGAKADLGYGMSGATYGDFGNLVRKEYYDETNYNLSLEGHAQFVYFEDDDLYFTFTGDDDVYLYINGVRVLDIGGAHGISKVSISLNSVADKIGLEDGEAYPFDFFYMERHGTAANFGIETNIQLVESAMTTTKTGYQYGTSTGYNGYVDPNEKVAYSFSLQNNGNAPIYNLTFDDPAIGVYFGHDKVEVNKKGNYTDIEKEMYLYRFGTDGKPTLTIPAGSLTAEKIIAELKKPLPVGETIAIYGFKYKISNEEWETGDDNFNNIVYTTATVNESLTSEQLHGKADWNVQKAPLSYEPFHVYDWVRKSAKDKEWGQRPDGVLELTENELRQYFVKGLDLKGNVLEDFNQKELEFVLCNASGNEDSLSKNTCAEMDNENDKIIYRSDKPGKETVFFKMKGSGLGTNNLYDNFVFSFDVYTYGVMDNVYVLDYGLEVELNCDKYGFQVNDHLSIAENMYNPATTIRIQTGTEEQKFGDYVFNADKAEDAADKAILDETYDSVKYVPKTIIDGEDHFVAGITICEPKYAEASSTDKKFYGIDMYETVSTVPANVVYYEENFPGITYVNGEGEDGNQWVHYETMVEKKDENGDVVTGEDGNPVLESGAGTNQSPDQDMNYGYDPNYKEDVSGEQLGDGETWTPGEPTGTINLKLDASNLGTLQSGFAEALNRYFGYTNTPGSDSNGTVNILEVKETAEVMYFDFVGTGFEIISRTTDEEYAVVNVTVYELGDDGNILQVQKKDANGDPVLDENGNPVMINKIVAMKPVITESKGGDLYQVPIISITGLTRDKYRVSVLAVGSSTAKTRVLYIDGIRIYGPLPNDQAINYYNPAEYQAKIFEVKDLIQDGKLVYMSSGSEWSGEVGFMPAFIEGYAYTLIENIAGEETDVLVKTTSMDEYLKLGPNNELYLNEYIVQNDENVATCNLIACILTEVDEYPEQARTIQIGAHRKVEDNYDDNGYVNLIYGKNLVEMLNPDNTNAIQIKTGTEMYYPIDVNNLEKLDEGVYLLLLGMNASEESCYTTLALTNLKLAGYDISVANLATMSEYDGETVAEDPIVRSARRYYVARKELAEENKQDEDVEVNENLTITSASLKAAKVYSGKAATLTLKAGSEAQTVVVTDAQGNVVTATKTTRKVSGTNATFSFTWTVTGTKGESQIFTVRVYDANGLASVNSETVTVTIK